MPDFVQYAHRQKFDPGFLGLFVNPFFLARRALRKGIAAFAPQCTGKLIDIGCGSKPYRALFSGPYTGVEIDTAQTRAADYADVYYDGESLPFANETFSTALCNQVLEHVFEPDQFLREIHRVVRPQGTLLLTVPFAWDEHEQPADFARYSSFGLRAIIQRNGFEIIELRKTLADVRVIGQLFNAYLYKCLWSKFMPLNMLWMLLFFAPVSAVFTVLGFILPKNDDFYLDNIVLARKVTS
jgi:SAM-dependent methyltransferase